MSDWPRGMEVRPITSWPGALTAERRRSPFRAGLSATLKLLDLELWHLGTHGKPVLEVAIPAEQFRLDGRPRANAQATHPGVVLSVVGRPGPMSYPCDSFLTWQDNLRAIALALEALRKVDRYGVTRAGEQYRGFLAIEPASSMSPDDAIEVLRGIIPSSWTTFFGHDVASLRGLITQAKRAAHPDLGGTDDEFDRVIRAERVLRDAGRLS